MVRVRWTLDHADHDPRQYVDLRLIPQAELLAARMAMSSDAGAGDGGAGNSVGAWEGLVGEIDRRFNAERTREAIQPISRALGNGTCHRRGSLPMPEVLRAPPRPIPGAPLIADGLRAIVARRALGGTAAVFQCDMGAWLEVAFAPRDPPDGTLVVVSIRERPAP